MLLRATVKGQRISRVELIDSLPNGEYILEYFYGKLFHSEARVVNGALEIL